MGHLLFDHLYGGGEGDVSERERGARAATALREARNGELYT